MSADLLDGAASERRGLSHDRQNARLRRRRSRPRRLWAQGNIDRRDRNAGSDGDARRICRDPTPEGRPRRRFASYDDPDGGADRDAEIARRRRPLGFVQHLFDAGSRRRRDRRGRHAGLRHQGREPEGLLGLHASHFRMERRRLPEHDPRRRRRRDGADSLGLSRRAGRYRVPRRRPRTRKRKSSMPRSRAV